MLCNNPNQADKLNTFFGKEVLYTSFLLFFFMSTSLFLEESGASDFGSVYMILVFAIAALLLVLIAKPMFQSAQKSIPKTSN